MKKILFSLGMILLILLPLSGQTEGRPTGFPWPLAIAANVWLPGFGVGSFIQGDWVGATIQASTQLLSALGVAGFWLLGFPEAVAWAGIDVFLLSRAWGMVRPIIYAEKNFAKFLGRDEVQPKSFVAQILLNIFPSFGAGSFLQGDRFSGIIQFMVESIGFNIYIIGIYLGGVYEEGFELELIYNYHWEDDALRYIGIGVMGGGILWGIIRPIWFAHEFNAKLQESKVTLGIIPAITPSADRQGFDVAIELAVRCAIE